MPTLQRTFQGKTHILVSPSISKLERSSSNNASLASFLKRSEGEQVAKQSKVGLNTQEGFTVMDEIGDLKDQVGVQMHQFDSIKMKKAPEELVGGQ